VQSSGVTVSATQDLAGVKTLALAGATSGTLTVQPAATTTSYTVTLPSAQGAANSVLTNNGSGTLSWGAPFRLAFATQGVINDYAVTTTASEIPLDSLVDGSASTTYSGGLAKVEYDPNTIRSGNVLTLPTAGWYQCNVWVCHPLNPILGANAQDAIGNFSIRINVNNATGTSYQSGAPDTATGVNEGVSGVMTRYFAAGTTIRYIWDFTTATSNEDFIVSIAIYAM
jgi:hypothetical protein